MKTVIYIINNDFIVTLPQNVNSHHLLSLISLQTDKTFHVQNINGDF